MREIHVCEKIDISFFVRGQVFLENLGRGRIIRALCLLVNDIGKMSSSYRMRKEE
jgi:hypothetical protein